MTKVRVGKTQKKSLFAILIVICLTLPSSVLITPATAGSAWVTKDLTGGLPYGASESGSIDIDSHNRPHIVYTDDNSPRQVWYDYQEDDIKWIDTCIDEGNDPSLILDGNDIPHISYHSDYNLKYARWTGSSWDIDTVDGSSGVQGADSSIALDSNGQPHISYWDYTNSALKYARWTGSSWDIDTVDYYNGAGCSVGRYTSLALTTNDVPYISYLHSVDGAVKCAHLEGSTWITDEIDAIQSTVVTSLALDSFNRPHVSYYDESGEDLKYAYFNGLHWQYETVDSNGDVGAFSSLEMDTNDNPHISYYDGTDDELNFAYKPDAVWQHEIVDTMYTSGYKGTSLVLDSNDEPHICYINSNTHTLKYANKTASGPSPSGWRELDSPVDKGETFTVFMGADNYGASGKIVETIPAGFTYEGSSLDPSQVSINGNEITFTLLGESMFDYTLTAPFTAGQYTFSGTLFDEDNNAYPIYGDDSLRVGEEGEMNLEVTAISCTPSEPEGGEPITFKVSIENSGNQDITAPFSNKLSISSADSYEEDTWDISGLDAGETYEHVYQTSLPPGTYVVKAETDVYDDVDESVEYPNEREVYLDVQFPADVVELIDEVELLKQTTLGKIDKDIDTAADTLTAAHKELWEYQTHENDVAEVMDFMASLTSPADFAKWSAEHLLGEIAQNDFQKIEDEQAKKINKVFGKVDIYNRLVPDSPKILQQLGPNGHPIRSYDVYVGDIDNDNTNEILCKEDMNGHCALVVYQYNTSLGNFKKIAWLDVSHQDIMVYTVADIDNNKENGQEIIIRTSQDEIMAYGYNSASKSFTELDSVPVYDPYCYCGITDIETGEIDGDKKNGLEILIPLTDKILIYHYNPISESFVYFSTLESTRTINKVHIADIDKQEDGKKEIILITNGWFVIETYRYTQGSFNKIVEDLEFPSGPSTEQPLYRVSVENFDNIESNGNEMLVSLYHGGTRMYRYNSKRNSYEKIAYTDNKFITFGDVDNNPSNGNEMVFVLEKRIGHHQPYEVLGIYHYQDYVSKFVKEKNTIKLELAGLHYGAGIICDATNNGKQNLLLATTNRLLSTLQFACYHYEPTKGKLQAYLRKQYEWAINNMEINYFGCPHTLSETKQRIESEYDDFISDIRNKFGGGLPDGYPLDMVKERIRQLRFKLIKSRYNEVKNEVHIWNPTSEKCIPIKYMGSVAHNHKKAQFLLNQLQQEKEKLEMWGYVGDFSSIAGTATTFLKVVGGISSAGAGSIALDLVFYGGVIPLLDWHEKGNLRKGIINCREGLVACALNARSSILHEIYLSELSFNRTIDMVLSAQDPSGEILEVHMPDIVLEEGKDIGSGAGYATVKNNLPEPVNVTLSGKIFGPTRFGKPLISAITTEKTISVGSNEIVNIPFEYHVVGTEAWGTCSKYAARIDASFGIDVVTYAHPVYFTVGQQATVDAANTQAFNEILNGQIKQGEVYETQYEISPDTYDAEFSLHYEGSDIDLHLYGPNGHHIGVNYTTNTIEQDIPDVSYSGNQTNPEYIVLHLPDPGTYRVEIVGTEVDGNESFYVTATETPEYPPLLALTPASVELTASSEEQVKQDIFIQEYGGQKNLAEFAYSMSRLEDDNGHYIPPSAVEVELPQGQISGGSSEQINISFKCPKYVSNGTYTGMLRLSSNNNTTYDTCRLAISTHPLYSDTEPPASWMKPDWAGKQHATPDTLFSIQAEDNSQYYHIHYKIRSGNNGGTEKKGDLNSPVKFNLPLGSYHIEYWAEDTWGNTEDHHILSVRVVDPYPDTTVTFDGPHKWNTTCWQIIPDTNIQFKVDTGGIGLQKTKYRIGDTDWKVYRGSLHIKKEGTHEMLYYSIDKNGNIEDFTNSIHIDVINDFDPLTTCTLNPSGPNGNNGWYTCGVKAILAADGSIAGINTTTYYRLNNGCWKEYTVPITIAADGIYSLGYYSSDNTGNKEEKKSISFQIDQTAPSLRFDKPHDDHLYIMGRKILPLKQTVIIGHAELSVKTTDKTSGIHHVELYADGKKQKTLTKTPYKYIWNEPAFFKHTIKAVAYDTAGNKASTQQDIWIFNI